MINSNRKVRVPEYKDFCTETYLLIKEVDWIVIAPTIHMILAHSAELILDNKCYGLLNFSESGIEANNKFLRQYRVNYSRKTNQYDNLTDCINRLWDKSDIAMLKFRERLHCSYCSSQGHIAKSCSELKSKHPSCSTEFDNLLSLFTYEH